MNLLSPPITSMPEGGTSAARTVVEQSYAGALRVGSLGGRNSLRNNRITGIEFVLDDIDVTGTVDFCATPSAGVLVGQGVRGHLEIRQQHGWVALPVGEPVLAAPGMPWQIRATNSRVRLASVRPSALARLLDGLKVPLTQSPLRFRSGRPYPHLVGMWNRSIDYVADTAIDEVSSSEVVAETCARVLAAAALLCFPRTEARHLPDANDADVPEQLRVAMAFITDNAREDVGVSDVARAVHLSTRAVQYLFRRHLDMTPMEYLKSVRLRGAHRDLVASDPAVTSVGEVAASWRFGHTGRFAAAYRETFGRSPHFVLGT